MKKCLVMFGILLGSASAFSQEDCNDGVDNDGDTFVDLNDTECDCAGFGGSSVASLIPNPSFEDMTCCPTSVSMLYCATGWIQASTPTSDYFNTCGYSYIWSPPSYPLPGGGAGYAGFYFIDGWKEYIGSTLLGPMTAGTTYVLNCWVAWSTGETDLPFALYGTPTASDLPWADVDCPVSIGDWVLLDDQTVTVTTDGAWHEVTLTFTPSVDINAVALGGDCSPPGGGGAYNYYFVDELVLIDSLTFSGGGIAESGDWCDSDLLLTADLDTTGGSWQWYFEGEALVGETGSTLDVMPTGPGTYQAVYTIGSDCHEISYTVSVPDAPVADFTYNDVCLGLETDFNDASTIGGSGTITDWDWDFDDGGVSTLTDPSHTYATAGTYTVALTVTSDDGCTHTMTHDVSVFPAPNADFEFEINGLSSSAGATGGCIIHPIDLTDESTVTMPETIDEWDWNFGDAGSSTLQNPTHTYAGAGTYTITLIVTTENGCTDSYNMDIVMTDSPTIDVIFSNPVCFGFTDGSVTVNVSGGSGSELIEIKNEADVIVNATGSNTANSLGGGWYYITVEDGSGCNGEASIFLDEPEPIDAEMTLQMPLCFGDSGYAVVNTVLNAQGDPSNITYIWNPDPAGVSGLGADSSWNLTAGNYSLIINDDFGCSNEITFEITEPTELIFTEIGYEPAFCRLFPYQSGNGVVFASAGGGTPDYSYLWENLSTGLTWTPTTWGGLNPGDYKMTVTDDNGCILTQIVTVDSLNPIADFTVTSDQLNTALEGTAIVCATFTNASLNFSNINDPLADTTFFWNLDSPNAPWVISHDFFETFDTCYTEGGEYEVCLVAQNKNGCVDTACKTITVFTPPVIVAPNIFTPDGDGINDIYTFDYLAKGINTFHCVIVNRWGLIMSELDNIQTGWNGTDKSGSVCSDGVYFFKYVATADNGEELSGQGTIQIVGSHVK